MAQAGKRGGHSARTSEGRRTSKPHNDARVPGGDPVAVGSTEALTSKLEPRRGPVKVQLNTWVLASTEARLKWLVKNRQFTVTSVVDVALQELLDRYDVPPADPDGRIGEQ
ncbi:hypothetical protein ACVH9Z_15240 [Rhodococcus opacus]|uniref:hypothetical protein n=1 Tax=Rhodococcus opacus TaxID=37919 RepID=UPI0020167C92|nr:hypothetical protein [Rhodococcus opacus]MDJ0419665.1 hypothetical protein [Rhodococcus opacus]MDV7088176.1 hypothetical protein [Rhodococcus opacus]WKN52544.1 hypothetical protein HJ581_0001060 [Rhodococcus opacus]